jgi:putative membrane protein insertion efficiency factor
MWSSQEAVIERVEQGLVAVVGGAIGVYQIALSPVLPRACRFRPTCSEYALEALKRHGVVSGTILAIRRVLRCHPLGGSGLDPVP